MGRGGSSGGGRSGGSRSFGGGSHSRSFGGSSSRSSRGGGSSFSSSGRGGGRPHVSSGGGYRPGRTVINRHYHYGPSYGYGRTYHASGFSGFVATVICMILLFVVLIAVFGTSSSSKVTSSTIEREKLKAYEAFSKNCVDDDADWITSRSTLLKGMESFYKDTGVQPALAIYEEIDGQKYLSNSDIEAFMDDEYDELIGHERGVLLLFCEYADSDYYVYYKVGEDAQTLMDSEACDILIDYVHDLYVGNYSDSEYFSAVFEKTADRIMTVTPTVASKIPIIVFGVVIIVIAFAGVKALKQKHKRDAEKAAETERILNSPIDRI